MKLQAPTPPALPYAPPEYSATQQNSFGSVLRLFLNSLSSFCNGLSSSIGMGYLKAPYGSFLCTTNQVAAVVNTPQRVSFDTQQYINSMYAVAGDGLHMDVPGIYNLQFCIQFENSDVSINEGTVWFRKNGVDVPASAISVSVHGRHASINGYVLATANFYIQMAAGDYVELWWASSHLSLIMEAYTASVSPFARPSIPAAVATISFVSAV